MPDEEKPAGSKGVTREEVAEFVRNIIATKGAEQAVRDLGQDNLQYRNKLRDLKAELEGFRTRNPQGSVVLVGEDVTLWNSAKPVLGKLKEKGIKIEDVPKVIEDKDKLEGELVATTRKSASSTAAKELGLNEELFTDLISTKGLQLEKKKVTVQIDGKSEQQDKWHVRPAGDASAQPVLIEDSGIKSYLRALKVEGGTEGGDNDGESTEEVVTTTVPPQSKSGKADGKKDVASTIIRRYASPSDLRKAAQK